MWLETDRFRLRRWHVSEIDALEALHAAPLRHVNAHEATHERCERWLVTQEEHWEEHGFGALAITSLADDTPIGWVSLSIPTWLPAILPDASPALEVNWVVHPSHQNRGVATEAATAWLDWGFEMLGVDRILGITVVGDDASTRVLEKLRMHVVGPLTHPRTGKAVIVHAVDCNTWRSAPDAPFPAAPPWHERLDHV